MADLDPSILFGVKGLVAVITGGGTGHIIRFFFYAELTSTQASG